MTIALIDGDVLHHACLWKTSSVQDYKANVEEMLEEWLTSSISDEPIAFLTPDSSFRLELHPGYKQSVTRVAGRKRRVDHEPEAKAWLREQSWAKIANDGLEADDMLAIFASTAPYEKTIITVDKDLRQVPGRHFYTRTLKSSLVTVPESFYNLQFQLLCGDAMDSIPGISGVGPGKAARLLAEGFDPVDIYKEKFGSDWAERFLWNGKLLYLLRKFDDEFSVDRYEKLKDEAKHWALDSDPEGI